MYAANLGLRFGLEIAALTAVAYAGFQAADGSWLSWLLAVAATLAFTAVWGTWVSPRAPHRLRDPNKLVVEVLLFSIAAVALGLTGMTGIAVLFAVFVAGNLAMMFYLSQRDQ
jgi:hypothetical protein